MQLIIQPDIGCICGLMNSCFSKIPSQLINEIFYIFIMFHRHLIILLFNYFALLHDRQCKNLSRTFRPLKKIVCATILATFVKSNKLRRTGRQYQRHPYSRYSPKPFLVYRLIQHFHRVIFCGYFSSLYRGSC